MQIALMKNNPNPHLLSAVPVGLVPLLQSEQAIQSHDADCTNTPANEDKPLPDHSGSNDFNLNETASRGSKSAHELAQSDQSSPRKRFFLPILPLQEPPVVSTNTPSSPKASPRIPHNSAISRLSYETEDAAAYSQLTPLLDSFTLRVAAPSLRQKLLSKLPSQEAIKFASDQHHIAAKDTIAHYWLTIQPSAFYRKFQGHGTYLDAYRFPGLTQGRYRTQLPTGPVKLPNSKSRY